LNGGAIDEEFISGLFGLGGGASSTWFGPQFDNTSSAYSFFDEFFVNNSLPVMGNFAPVKIDITHKMPSRIYFGSGEEVTFTQYQSVASPARGNELWIVKGADWSQYAITPAGTGLQLIALAPAGGLADYYDISQTGSLDITSKQMSFYTGYNSLNFMADKVGRHILIFLLRNQPSNAIIVDVIPASSQLSQNLEQMPPATIAHPPAGVSSSTVGVSAGYPSYADASGPISGPAAAEGDTPVTIQTTMKGYDVYVDNVFMGKDGEGGDLLDGVFSFTVEGGQTHTIRVFDGVNNFEKPMYFDRRVAKVINVPPATTIYATGGLA
jgi:hypothetical protein